MAFTRKFLKALGIEDEKVETIMEEHTAVTDGLKKDRDTYKANADKAEEVQRKLDEALAANADTDGTGWKKKYEDLVKENQRKETYSAQEAAYKRMLESAGVGKNYIPLLVKANRAEIEKLELADGKVKDEGKAVDGLKTSLADYISTTTTSTSGTPATPPANSGKKAMTRNEIMAIKDDNERQQAIAENIELFK